MTVGGPASADLIFPLREVEMVVDKGVLCRVGHGVFFEKGR